MKAMNKLYDFCLDQGKFMLPLHPQDKHIVSTLCLRHRFLKDTYMIIGKNLKTNLWEGIILMMSVGIIVKVKFHSNSLGMSIKICL